VSRSFRYEERKHFTTVRTTYRLAGQIVAVQTKVGTEAGTFYYTYSDRQSSVYALRKTDGTWVNGNYARYDAYGGYRTKPPASVNPGISDRGFTGQRMNNTGNDLGLIYMNARYYLPEVGRFISQDTIVSELLCIHMCRCILASR
jgi:RHS repeat-associated protein